MHYARAQLQEDTTAFKRDYTEEIRTCDELEAILDFFAKEMHHYDITPKVRLEHRSVRTPVPRFLPSLQFFLLSPPLIPPSHSSTPAPALPLSSLLVLSQPTADEEFRQWRENQHASNVAEGKDAHRPLLEYWKEILLQEHGEYQELVRRREYHMRERSAAIEALEVIERMAEMHDMETGSSLSAATGRTVVSSAATVGAAAAATRRGGAFEDESKRGPPPPSPQLGPMATSAAGAAAPGDDLEDGFRFRHIAGTIKASHMRRFDRMVVRASKRQAYVRFAEPRRTLTDEKGETCEKLVFAVFYHAPSVAKRVRAVCTAYGASLYSMPDLVYRADAEAALSERVKDLRDTIFEHADVLNKQRSVVEGTLLRLSASLENYRRGVRREKATSHTLNRFVPAADNMLRGEGWVLESARSQVEDALRLAHTVSGHRHHRHHGAGAAGAASAASAAGSLDPALVGRTLPYFCDLVPRSEWGTPPTHFPLNEFTAVYQSIVDTYGVPRYQEANPALFTAVTFPFLFGVMYGDVGHSTFLFFTSLAVVLMEGTLKKRMLGEMSSMIFGARYMLLMMGFFGIYCGFVYNDIFSLTFDLFGTRYEWPVVNGTEAGEAVRISEDVNDVYPFGIDPTWYNSENELLFFNSLKMKMSVIIGVIHMTFGLILKGSNAIYFGSRLDLYGEVLPQIIFMVTLFGYMLFLIIYKWSTDWTLSTRAPPSLIDTLIGIVLTPGTIKDPMFDGQEGLHLIILAVIFITVPWMLFVKPCVLSKKHEHDDAPSAAHLSTATAAAARDDDLHGPRRPSFGREDDGAFLGVAAGAHHKPDALADAAASHADEAHNDHAGGNGGHEEHSFGELMIHQGIESIEFVLGAISNTASYLRLWALSLAHSELAHVFWQKAMDSTIEMGNPFAIVVGFAIFAGITFGVLCVMDVLECYLHALRLHWVEFQNKFYKADGYKFTPFSFDAILDAK